MNAMQKSGRGSDLSPRIYSTPLLFNWPADGSMIDTQLQGNSYVTGNPLIVLPH